MALLRRPRFQRSPSALPFQLTHRDSELIERVFEHRFLNSTQLITLVHGSRQQTLRRLQRLYHHGYLDRPRCQIDLFHQLGTRPMIYGLGKMGARILLAANGSQQMPVRWSARHSSARRIFLDHTLRVADVVIAFEVACRNYDGVQFIPATQLQFPRTFGAAAPVRWSVSFAGEEITVVPDAVFALDVRTENRSERIYYFLEADCGTMPVIRKKLRQTSLWRKLLAYEATWSQGIHRTALGIDRFRVLTVTTNRPRAEHLRETSLRLQRGHGLFLFTDQDSLIGAADLFGLHWHTAKPSPVSTTLLG
jgi:Replication-relaxation